MFRSSTTWVLALGLATAGLHCASFGADTATTPSADAGSDAASDGSARDASNTNDDSGSPGTDAGGDGAPKPRCDPNKPWGTPVVVPDLSSSLDDSRVSLTRDELTAVLTIDESAGSGSKSDIAIARRSSQQSAFGDPTKTELGSVNTAAFEGSPSISADGTLLYFQHQGPSGFDDILLSIRTSTATPFGTPQSVFAGGSAVRGYSPFLSHDAQTLYWTDLDLTQSYQATRQSPSTWSAAQVIHQDATNSVGGVVVSADGLTLYTSDSGGTAVLVAKRTSKAQAFPTPTAQPALNAAGSATIPAWISEDDCLLYLVSNRGGPATKGGYDVFVARRPL